jgi:hypothetical protein
VHSLLMSGPTHHPSKKADKRLTPYLPFRIPDPIIIEFALARPLVYHNSYVVVAKKSKLPSLTRHVTED